MPSTPDSALPTPEAGVQDRLVVGPPSPLPQAPAAGRKAFRDLRRQLTDEELASSGVQKLILDELETAEFECVELQMYVDRYHTENKRAAVLEEKLKTDRAIEVFFGFGTALGGAVFGLSPYFYELFKPDKVPGTLVLGIGLVLMAGATFARFAKR